MHCNVLYGSSVMFLSQEPSAINTCYLLISNLNVDLEAAVRIYMAACSLNGKSHASAELVVEDACRPTPLPDNHGERLAQTQTGSLDL